MGACLNGLRSRRRRRACWVRSGARTWDGLTGASEKIRRTSSRPSASSVGIGRVSWPCRYWSDRHPDHVVASGLLTEAVFNAGLRRYEAEGEAWKTDWVCYYFINDTATPSFVVDVSAHYETKRRALDCHASQFTPPSASGEVAATRLNTPLFRQMIESRDAQFGALAGVRWAEGFIVREPVLRRGLLRWPV